MFLVHFSMVVRRGWVHALDVCIFFEYQSRETLILPVVHALLEQKKN